MLQVARLAPELLDQASDRVVAWLHDQVGEDGGFRDRSGNSDLYYTVFGLEGLIALREPVTGLATREFLRGFGHGEGLDLVHLACLARCWAALGCEGLPRDDRRAILARVETFRSRDGGYAAEPGADHGTAYHSFLALGAYQDLGPGGAPAGATDDTTGDTADGVPNGGPGDTADGALNGGPDGAANGAPNGGPGGAADCPPRAAGILRCLDGLRSADGGWANRPGVPAGTTTATAAAEALYRHLGGRPSPGLADWLLDRVHPGGGFVAAPGVPMPDLLSTATALHALSGLGSFPDRIREPCLDFVDSLWTGRAFCGHWADDAPDVEYTYYGLLALGHLSL